MHLIELIRIALIQIIRSKLNAWHLQESFKIEN